jgi:hypothetical protein
VLIFDKIESKLRSDKDRESNLERGKIRGVGRVLYMDRKVKLSRIDSLMASNKGLALTKLGQIGAELKKSKTTKPESA